MVEAGCTEYNAVRRRSIALSVFGVSTFKGLLSIPCDGRGARRPLGQSFRESVGPAGHLYLPLAQSVKLSAQVSGRVIDGSRQAPIA